MENVKSELQHIITGDGQAGSESQLKKIQNILRQYAYSSTRSKEQKYFKSEEEKLIHSLGSDYVYTGGIDESLFISEGAEQKVYKYGDYSVLKLNTAVFYECWLDYLNSLLIHNFFFSSTSYQLLGFTVLNEEFLAVVKQDFIVADNVTNLDYLQQFLEYNSFSRIRNNDYKSSIYGILLEDLHDENVLSKDGLFYFIDTVFYLDTGFYD